MEFRAREMSAIKASRPTPRCRAHVQGRCINGSACKHPHTTDPANITCNSMVTAGSVSLQQVLWRFCALHQKNMACPYKDCVHKLVTDELQTEADHEPPNEKMET